MRRRDRQRSSDQRHRQRSELGRVDPLVEEERGEHGNEGGMQVEQQRDEPSRRELSAMKKLAACPPYPSAPSRISAPRSSPTEAQRRASAR